MKKQLKSSRKRMAGRIGKRCYPQAPGVYTRLNSKQEEVTLANRARRRAMASISRRYMKRQAVALPTGVTEIPTEVKL